MWGLYSIVWRWTMGTEVVAKKNKPLLLCYQNWNIFILCMLHIITADKKLTCTWFWCHHFCVVRQHINCSWNWHNHILLLHMENEESLVSSSYFSHYVLLLTWLISLWSVDAVNEERVWCWVQDFVMLLMNAKEADCNKSGVWAPAGHWLSSQIVAKMKMTWAYI